jgi:hypothetical protein
MITIVAQHETGHKMIQVRDAIYVERTVRLLQECGYLILEISR